MRYSNSILFSVIVSYNLIPKTQIYFPFHKSSHIYKTTPTSQASCMDFWTLDVFVGDIIVESEVAEGAVGAEVEVGG